MPSITDKAASWVIMAHAMNRLDGYGPLHVVIGDGNVLDEHINGCLADPNLSADERRFAEVLLTFGEDERAAIFELTCGTKDV